MSLKPAQNPISERVALVAESVPGILRLRSDLVYDLTRRGHRVLCIAPPAAGKYMRELRDLGAQHRPLEFFGFGPALLTDWSVLGNLVEILNEWEPNVALAYGLKHVVRTASACKRAGVGRVLSILNEVTEAEIDRLGPRRVKEALRLSTTTIFHNHEDAARMSAWQLLPPGQDPVVLPGGGVNLVRFAATPLPSLDGGLVFLMLSKLERPRGVLEYAAAAKAVKAENPTARFHLAGPPGAGKDAVPLDAIVTASQGAIEYLGDLDDVRPALKACHVYVYPARQEGMPRSVLEALAIGRPAITTDTPGCRETVDERVSGCLVQGGNATALATAIESFIRLPEHLAAMSRAARLKAERRFDAFEVNRRMFEMIGLPYDLDR